MELVDTLDLGSSAKGRGGSTPLAGTKLNGDTMSQDFVQFTFPCKDCLVRAACTEKPENEAIKHLFYDNRPRCLAVPKFPPDITYQKGLLECWTNLGVDIINSLRKSEDPKTQTEKHNKIPMQYVTLMSHMLYLLQWISNSTSWGLGELKDFDQHEIKLKIKGFHI